MNKTMIGTQWLLLLVLAVLWGGSFFFVEIAVPVLLPLTVVAARIGLAAPADMGILNNLISSLLIVWGQTRIASRARPDNELS